MPDRRNTIEVDADGNPVGAGGGQVCASHDRRLEDHEARLRILEAASWKIAGFAGALAFLGTIAAKWIVP